MTDEAPVLPRSRRFPLTLTALVGSAIAIPLYVGLAAEGHDAPSIDAPPAAEPTAREIEAETKAEMKAEMKAEPASPPGSPSRHRGEEGRMSAPAADAGPGSGGLGLVGTGRGGGGAMAEASGRMGDAPAPKTKAGLYAMKGPRDEGGAGPAGGYDSQIAAGQLTAGVIDDLKATKLLDELRTRVIGIDTALAQAVPDHMAKGPEPEAGRASSVLEIAIVLDTTGSMGDEIQYLKAEIKSIAEEIGRDHPDVTQRYALVAYRDEGDDYVVRGGGFEPLDAFVDRLGAEFAGGGGDFPEAMERAMQSAADLQWSSSGAARLVFLVADAPPHAAGYESLASATGKLAREEVSVYPVASSGVDPVCEYLMRWTARTTGGRYLFLTDHSGIGDPHAAPHVDEYELKALRAHMLDMIRLELGDETPHTTHVDVDVSIAQAQGEGEWLDRHGLFVLALGGVFLLGFAGDMALSAMRRRRSK